MIDDLLQAAWWSAPTRCTTSTILGQLDRIRDCRAAKSLIDIALWDLRGKLLGQPVWRLLGGGPAKPVPLTWVAHGNTREAQVDGSRKRMVLDRGYKG